ncbi:MAG: hypothetical protein HON95_08530 [Alphaproteobacteria bacterium]|nr:hypothetical protein [Alphaproteobacteria bacterium]
MDHKEAMSRLRLARTTYVGPIICQLLMAVMEQLLKHLLQFRNIGSWGAETYAVSC